MGSKTRSTAARRKSSVQFRLTNSSQLDQLLGWILPEGAAFAQAEFHGNTRWNPEQLAGQALIWSWQETRNVTDAFTHAQETCDGLGWRQTAQSYTSMMNALERYGEVWMRVMRDRCQALAEKVGGQFFRVGGWVFIGFDGARATAPRSTSNERAFCAPGYGHGKRAKYGKKKSKGLQRKRNQQHFTHPPAPQTWITLLWHMSLRLPWTWRLGSSNASERKHVQEMLASEEFPENSLFCGDAGFVGYPLWSSILKAKGDFVVRVGANVNLLSTHADVKKLGGGTVLCWPKGKMASGEPPLRLRLAQVRIGNTKVWLLTSVLEASRLTLRQLVRVYKMRWGIEVEFRGLKQTIDKHHLRCRNSARVLVELNWSLCGMAVAELLALREQLARRKRGSDTEYDPRDRSLANTLRALRTAMRNLNSPRRGDDLLENLSRAKVQRYRNRTNKQARYRPANPDKKPLGEPNLRKITAQERMRLNTHYPQLAA